MHVLDHFPLQALNSFRVPAYAAHYIRFDRVEEITNFCTTIAITKKVFYILGNGTNTLFVENFPGYLLHVCLPGIEVIKETATTVYVKAAAGVHWHQLVLYCIKRGYGGIENLSLIPGSVGAAPVQNIGAYGVTLEDLVKEIESIELASGKKRVFHPEAGMFGYRTSLFKTTLYNQYLITAITLQLHKTNKFCLTYGEVAQTIEKMRIKKLSYKTISEVIIAIRQQKLPDPNSLANAGSFFKNPSIPIVQYQWLHSKYPFLQAWPVAQEDFIKVSAAALIEIAGFKGLRQGHVGVYDRHALILVNHGGATGKEIFALAMTIQETVKKLFNITLIPEVKIVSPKGEI